MRSAWAGGVRTLVTLGRAVDARFARISLLPDFDAALAALAEDEPPEEPSASLDPRVQQLLHHLARLTLREDLDQALPQLDEGDAFAPVFDALGAVQGDIRELLEAQGARSKELQAMIDGLRAGVLLESPQRKISVANAALCDMLRLPFSHRQLRGMKTAAAWEAALPRFVDPDEVRAETARVAQGGEHESNRLLPLVDGRVVERDYVPVRVDGKTRSHLWIYRDVTEREGAAAKLAEARDAALAASRAKSEFLATMSHEIRTPLNAIMGMTEMLAHSQIEDRHRRLAKVAHEGAEVLLGIVNEILDIGHLESGALQLIQERFNLHRLLHDLVTKFQERAHQRGISSPPSVAGLPAARSRRRPRTCAPDTCPPPRQRRQVHA